jgi:hypothetical protein
LSPSSEKLVASLCFFKFNLYRYNVAARVAAMRAQLASLGINNSPSPGGGGGGGGSSGDTFNDLGASGGYSFKTDAESAPPKAPTSASARGSQLLSHWEEEGERLGGVDEEEDEDEVLDVEPLEYILEEEDDDSEEPRTAELQAAERRRDIVSHHRRIGERRKV